MSIEDAVFGVADAMLAEGEEPSVRKIVARLTCGAKTRHVCEALRDWREKRGHDGKGDAKELSQRLRSHLSTFGREAYRIAQQDAARAYVRERENAKAVRQAEIEDLEHLLGRLERADAENAVRRVRQVELEAENAALRARVSDLLAAEFWDRVMRAIKDVLPHGEWVRDRDLLGLLPPSLAREAIVHGDPLTRGTLNKKMGVRITHGKYFDRNEGENGARFYRRAAE